MNPLGAGISRYDKEIWRARDASPHASITIYAWNNMLSNITSTALQHYFYGGYLEPHYLLLSNDGRP